MIYLDDEEDAGWGPYEENEEFRGTEVYLLSCTPDNITKDEIFLSWTYGCSKEINHMDDESYEVIIPYNNGCKDGFIERKWVDGEWKKEPITINESMVGKYVKTPGEGETNEMSFPGGNIYINGVTQEQIISSDSVSYSHTRTGSFRNLFFNGNQIYRESTRNTLPLGISFASGSGTSNDPYITAWAENRENGNILSNIVSGDRINGVEVSMKTDSTITFLSNSNKCFRKDNSGKCHFISETMTFEGLSANTTIYILSGKYFFFFFF